MAAFHDRTIAPRVQRGLLRASGPCAVLTSDEVIALTAAAPDLPIPFVFRPSPKVDDPRSADDLLEEIAAEIDRQAAPEPEPFLPMADLAQARHLRRQLVQAAEHGAALLASLGLPRLVTPDFRCGDITTAGDALDLAIATLDALDGDTDVEDGADDEPSLGWIDGRPQLCGDYQDFELDTADAEPSLASPERHPNPPVVTWCGPFTARGGDGSQLRWAEGARHDGEALNEDGDDLDKGEHDTADHESYLGWPEDIAAETSGDTWVLTADPDAEHDDGDLEGDPASDLTWVFGPSRREVAHV